MDSKYELKTCQHGDCVFAIPESVENFEQNYLKKHPHLDECCHNIYHIVSEDIDGNVVDECFGMNVLTDQGFYDMYKHDWASGTYNIGGIYIGDGVFETIDPVSKEMVHAISTTSANITKSGCQHVNTKWIPEKESNRVVWRLCVGWFDYTIWSEDKTVTEIGLSTVANKSINNLKYHAAIYDAEGNKSSFVKKVNQKLTIYVYGRTYLPIVKIINQMWDKGFRGAIRSNAMFQQSYNDDVGGWYRVGVCYYPYNWYFDKTCTEDDLKYYTQGTITDNVYSTEKTLGMNLFMDGRYQYISDIVIGTYLPGDYSVLYNQYWLFATKIRSPEPVPFRMEFYRNMAANNRDMRETYGERCTDKKRSPLGQLPMTNIHITSLTTYNGQTDQWDIDVPYVEPIPYLEGSYRHLRYSIRESNWITFKDQYESYTVFINEAPEYPIKQIENFDKTMYVTDAYWDSSTWEIIPNTNNISREQGSKRFFIMFEKELDWYAVDDVAVGYYGSRSHTRRVIRYDYDDNFPKLNLNNGYSEDGVNFGCRNIGYYSNLYGSSTYNGKSIANEALGYIAQDGFLVFPDSVDPDPAWPNHETPTHSENIPGIPYRYNIGGVDLPDGFLTGRGYDGTHPGMIWNTTRGTHIANLGLYSYLKGVRVYTMTDDPTVVPDYENFVFDQQFSAWPGISHSDNGYLVFSYLSGDNNKNCTYVLAYDVIDQPPTMYKVEGYHHGFAIDLTNYFVAIDASVTDHLHMVIYDMANQTIHDEFDIPEGYGFGGIAGWKDFIYVRVGQGGTAYSTYLYNIKSRILEHTSINIVQMRWDTSSWYSHIQRAVPSNGNIQSCMVLLASDRDYEEQHMLFKESDPTHPISLIRAEARETSSYVRLQKAWMGYTSDNNKLILTYSTYRLTTIDVSWALRHGTINQHFNYADLYDNNDAYSPIYYKGYIYIMQLYRYDWVGGDLNIYTSYCRYWRNPYQQHIDLCIEGTTYTPNSMMNPVRIQGDIAKVYLSATNRNVEDVTET